MTYDYTGHEASAAETSMDELVELARDMTLAAIAVDTAETALAKAKAELRRIQEQELPEKMEELGMSSFTTGAGVTIAIKETVRASIPKERNDKALEWLNENGYGYLQKHDFNVTFKKGEETAARTTRQELEVLGVPFKEKRWVHPSTLASFARERLEDGENLPEELFNVHRQRTAKVK